MVALARVKERTETDLSDTELQAMIDEIAAEIDLRFGLNAAIIVFLDGDRALEGDRRFLTLWRPIDVGPAITVTEIDITDEIVMAADDFRVLDGGRTIERLIDGTNGREFWERLVKVAYTPISNSKERDEIIILIVQLGIEHRGLKSEKAGDLTATFADYSVERDKLLARLMPRRGLSMA